MRYAQPLLLGLLTLGACASDYRSMTVKVSDQPARTTFASALNVPDECPIYTPTGRDIDTPELPYDSPLLFGCAVDDAGATYGVVTGDVGDLAILDGNHELGLFLAFDSTLRDDPPTAEQLDVDGPSAQIKAFSAPVNVSAPDGHPVEFDPNARIPLRIVALGASGILVSIGRFDSAPTQASVVWDYHATFPGRFSTAGGGYVSRFYVNGPP